MPKTVEEILKEEGVIKPVGDGEDKEKIKFEEEIDLRKIVMSIEKLQTQVEAFKDIREQNEEKIRELTEKMGEIRSMFFQRETLIKETETKVKMLDDVISDINPQKFMKEIDKRKEEILESQSKIEKLELIGKDASNNLNALKQTMQNIKSVENLETLLNEIKDNVSKIRQIKDDVERASGKSERFYFEMENRIKEFIDLKDRTNKIDDLTKEVAKSVDSINIRLASFISKSDLEDFKKSVNSIISSNKDYVDSKLKEVESFLSLPGEEITNRVNQLNKRRVEISNLLLGIEEQYKKAFISEKTYVEVKQKNENILKQIQEELSQLNAGEKFSFKNLPSMINDLKDKSNALERKVEEFSRFMTKVTGQFTKAYIKEIPNVVDDPWMLSVFVHLLLDSVSIWQNLEKLTRDFPFI
jgi:chromosome segregation ATPase